MSKRLRIRIWSLGIGSLFAFVAPAAMAGDDGDEAPLPPLQALNSPAAAAPEKEKEVFSSSDEPEPPPPSVRAESVAATPRVTASYRGTPRAGSQVALNAEIDSHGTYHCRWIQTSGSAVELDDPSSRTPKFTVPSGSTPLGFTLVVGGSGGTYTASLTIPVEGGGRGRGPRAHAGDDQLGLVGRQVTLNGLGSEPKGRLGYRWIQTGGPPVGNQLAQGYVYSFVPHRPGIYRFALLVADGGAISEPDEVQVSVGGANGPGSAAGVEPAVTPADLARSAMVRIPGSESLSGALAVAFESTAIRMDLYDTYLSAYSELSRRLDEILPKDRMRRSLWSERLCVPLSACLVESMLDEGLDLRTVQGRNSPLTAGQKARLAELFDGVAEGLRAPYAAR